MLEYVRRKLAIGRQKSRLSRSRSLKRGLAAHPYASGEGGSRTVPLLAETAETPAARRAHTPPPPAEVPVVRLESISKRFGKVRANQDISLDIHGGRVLALLGENGAGKSTLMSMLAGRFAPDTGRILIDGEPVRLRSSRDAIEAGIGMVYQHFMLVDTMTVAQNVLLGQEGSFWLNPARMEERVGELAASYGLNIDPAARIEDLSMGERQRVEILKLLYRQSRVLIFDEPTSVLTPQEVEQLFLALRNMAAHGKAIVFITHKLDEVMNISDDIAVLRRGRVVDTVRPSEIGSKAELANRMVGKEVVLEAERDPVQVGDPVLEVENLSGWGLRDISFRVRLGEILAVVGVAGNGQKALAEVLSGIRAPGSGSVRLLGSPWKEFYARSGWKGALSYVPEDRLGVATVRDLDMVDNVLLTTRKGFTRGPFLTVNRAAKTTEELVRSFGVYPADPTVRAGQLSGGNLQKLVLAREFFRESRVIIAEQPSQGLDVGATEEVWSQLLAARRHAGILLVTGDLTEALHLADRVAVMFEGRFMSMFPVTDREQVDRIGLMMAGVAD